MTEKDKRKNKPAKRKAVIALLFVGVIFLLFLFFKYAYNGSILDSLPGEQDNVENTDTNAVSGLDTEPTFTMTMLDVGQGLAILIEADGRYMLYDGGGRDSSAYVVSYLSSRGIEAVDIVIASHYDEDHIAGLIGVLNTAYVGSFVCPEYEADTKIYESLCENLIKKGTTVIHPYEKQAFALGDAIVQVISPEKYLTEDQENENNYSVAVRISYGNFSCIITGDAEEELERSIAASDINIKSDVLVVGHHGSSSSSCEAFIKAVAPEYAFISCGSGNAYGHPAKRTLNTLKKYGVQIFRTDMQGEVSVSSDGEKYCFSEEACSDWSPGVYTG